MIATYPAGPNGGATVKLEERSALAYWLAFGRPPTATERKAAFDFFTRFPGNWKRGDDRAVATRDNDAVNAAWTSFSRALFASSEFRFLD